MHKINVLLWVDRPTRHRNKWFGFLAFVKILLLQVCLSERPFQYDIMGGSLKIWFSNGCCCITVGITSSLTILWDLELLETIILLYPMIERQFLFIFFVYLKEKWFFKFGIQGPFLDFRLFRLWPIEGNKITLISINSSTCISLSSILYSIKIVAFTILLQSYHKLFLHL